MKKTLASALIVICLLGSSIAPASAVLGLSKCEKVKKQVLVYEVTWKRLAADFSPAMGKNGKYFPENTFNSYVTKMNKLLDHSVIMYRYERNNPKCFTITQNENINMNWSAINVGIIEWNKIYYGAYYQSFPMVRFISIYNQ